MRILSLVLAAAMGVAAVGADAGRPATASMGPAPGAKGGWRGGPGHGNFNGGRPHRPRPGGHHGFHGGDRDRWRGHHDGRDPTYLYNYGAVGLDGPYEMVDPHGNGFFAGGGGEVRMENGRPRYDYDRSYPYEWGPSNRSAREPEARGAPRPAQPRCTMEQGVRVCRGGW